MPDVNLNEYEIYWIGAGIAVIVGIVYSVAVLLVRWVKNR